MSQHELIQEYASALRQISSSASDEGEIFEKVGPLARQLSRESDWIEDRFYEPDKETGFSAYLLHEEDDHSLAVLAASWVPGMGVGPHDHGTWAVVVGVEGVERNVRYKRLDDRSNPGYAELAVKDESDAGPGDLVCIKSGGIHSVNNNSDNVTLSLHTYGMHVNHTIRYQYDLQHNTATEFKVEIR